MDLLAEIGGDRWGLDLMASWIEDARSMSQRRMKAMSLKLNWLLLVTYEALQAADF